MLHIQNNFLTSYIQGNNFITEEEILILSFLFLILFIFLIMENGVNKVLKDRASEEADTEDED